MSPSVRFEPLSTCSWGNLRFSLKFCLGLDDKEEEEVLDEIYKHIITNDGYNQGLLTMHLFVTINESIVVHLGAKLPNIAALDVTETRHIWEKLCSISAVDDTETRQRAKVDEVVVHGGGGGEENCCVCFEELANEEQLVGLSCKHVFHEGCIVEWLGNSLSCPLCRFRLHAVLS
ncbi:probable E3 ubiquitin-protein ligase RHA4A [Beta vulgaris subsp. vulgaris]|uniref:probable E3 ubiquitin-protein ligase RHA4A n=1 Tax=Beta vulgaris subsp. vulgaris TaxID=3555 RepID=UPI0020371B29|nr:probable E3 ubiquitin-protein ligase RHA4A [Beta vulgaris subsp. vulgaris]